MQSATKFIILAMASCGITSGLSAAPPRVVAEGYDLQLVAQEPAIVTPVALAFDNEGSLLVVESHTHQRPDEYKGPTTDRIRRFADTNGDGTFDTWSTVAEGFRHTMNLVARSDGAVVVITRSDVYLLQDTNDDGTAETQTTLVHLESTIDYPHNAMGGFVFDGAGGFYLGLGENFGGAYRLVGSDGKSFADSGGTGMVFHFDNDGANLTKVAQGFWNPFGLGMASNKTLFAVDNDPDASPPCRLIHVVPTGDYGHRFEYGRAGVHPLQAWDGELPGTLPMVCGTGEAPCAVVPHENHLWVTSWGDHRLERYNLTPKGMSFAANRHVIVQGDADFRPTGCAVAPDGSLYFADWVSRSYPVHGKGRLWRVVSKEKPEHSEWRAIADVEQARSSTRPLELAGSDDAYARQLAVAAMQTGQATKQLAASDARVRLVALQNLRWNDADPSEALLRQALADADANVRLYALRWVADVHLTGLRDDVAKLLQSEIPNERYYLCVLGAIHWLDGDRSPPPKSVVDGLLARELRNARRTDDIKSLALRLISPGHKQLTLGVLNDYIEGSHVGLRTEAVRTLALSNHAERFTFLAKVAGDETMNESTRADAVAGLAGSGEAFRPLFERLTGSDLPAVAAEAARVLRLKNAGQGLEEFKPEASDIDTWVALSETLGNADAGRRLFYSAVGPHCGTCHTVRGRGGDYGPDLTRYGSTHDRKQTLTAILQPSRDIAPRYVPWVLETDDGKTHVGMRLPLAGDGGTEPYIDSKGSRFDLKSDTVEYREPSKKSIMPEGMEKTISVADLADLVAFLRDATTE